MARIKTTVRVAAYMNEPPEGRDAEAYLTNEGSRFAVTRLDAKTPWVLTHRASGYMVNSLLPISVRSTIAELLAIVSAWEAHTELDLDAFDLAKFGQGFDGISETNRRRVQRLSHELRDIALQVVVSRTSYAA